ncbi:MAG: hypothetical protein AB7Q00_14670 [Phycisphaerales bacterium]
MRLAKKQRIGARTLRRAADDMGVRRRVRGFGADKTSFWSISDEARKKWKEYRNIERPQLFRQVLDELDALADRAGTTEEQDLYMHLKKCARRYSKRL